MSSHYFRKPSTSDIGQFGYSDVNVIYSEESFFWNTRSEKDNFVLYIHFYIFSSKYLEKNIR
jgi:hypothetical protein